MLDNFEIVAIFESNCEPWFTGARVTTAAVILRHQPDAKKRAENRVKFALLTQPLSDMLTYAQTETDKRLTFEQLRDRIESMMGTEEFTICPGEGEPVRVRQETLHGLRVRIVKQDDLHRLGCLPFTVSEADESAEGNDTADGEETEETPEEGEGAEWNPTLNTDAITPRGEYAGYKWGIFLRAPNIFFKLLRIGGAAFRPLGQIARVKFGVKTGCDKFFFVKDKTHAALMELPDRETFKDTYGLYPEDTTAVRIVEAGDDSSHLIEAEYLEPIAFNLMEVDTAEVNPDNLKKHVLLVSEPKENLKGTHVLKYIQWGEEEGFHLRSTCANRLRWYELPTLERGATLWPMAQRYRHIIPLNASRIICNHNLFDVVPLGNLPAEVLTAVLNSTLVALCKHQFGRTMGGDPLLKTEVVDVKMMLVPDPSCASEAVRSRLTSALASMQKRRIHHLVAVDSSDPKPTGDLAMPDRQQLDDAVLELLGIADPEERECLRLELYAEMTRLYRSIRAAELRMNKFKAQKSRKGRITQQSIAGEIWDSFEPKPEYKMLADFAAGQPYETIYLPAGKAKAVNNLLAPHSLFVNGEYISLNEPQRVQYAKALSDAHISGAVAVPEDAAVCAAALKQYAAYEQQLNEDFETVAAEYTADEAMQKRVVHELQRKTRQQTH